MLRSLQASLAVCFPPVPKSGEPRPRCGRDGASERGSPRGPDTSGAPRPIAKLRQHLRYVYASLSRLDFRGLPEKCRVVFEGLRGFATAKMPTVLMMHWCNGGRGGVCPARSAADVRSD